MPGRLLLNDRVVQITNVLFIRLLGSQTFRLSFSAGAARVSEIVFGRAPPPLPPPRAASGAYTTYRNIRFVDVYARYAQQEITRWPRSNPDKLNDDNWLVSPKFSLCSFAALRSFDRARVRATSTHLAIFDIRVFLDDNNIIL